MTGLRSDRKITVERRDSGALGDEWCIQTDGDHRVDLTDSEAHVLLEALAVALGGEVEWAVRQEHQGRVWPADLDDEPWTEESARDQKDEIAGGTVVRRTLGPWVELKEEEA